jgi:hypothetical protein
MLGQCKESKFLSGVQGSDLVGITGSYCEQDWLQTMDGQSEPNPDCRR